MKTPDCLIHPAQTLEHQVLVREQVYYLSTLCRVVNTKSAGWENTLSVYVPEVSDDENGD